MSTFKHIAARALVSLGLLTGLTAQTATATTPAGSIIRNQAEATYFDPSQDRSFSVLSSIATVRVSAAYGLDLETDNELQGDPGEAVLFPHRLTNTGNLTDRYTLSLSGDLPGARLFLDSNGNGSLDDSETEISQTDPLPAGDSLDLLVRATLPANASTGLDYSGIIRAVSQGDTGQSRERSDRVTVSERTVFRITKDAVPACNVPVAPGESIQYSVSLLNLDGLRPHVRSYDIDGRAMTGILIEDPVPANTTLDAPDAVDPSPASAFRTVRFSASDALFTYGPTFRGASRVGLFLPESALVEGQSGRFTFSVTVNDGITEGTQVFNRIEADLDGDGRSDVVSNETCNTLKPDGENARATLRFIGASPTLRSTGPQAEPLHAEDAHFQDVTLYRLSDIPTYSLPRDGVYVEAKSTAMNLDADLAENRNGERFIKARIASSLTGDSLYVRLLETAPNSGLFRSERPVRLTQSDAGQGRDCGPEAPELCLLRSEPGDELEASIFDPGIRERLTDAAVVDPYGIVFDSASLAPVSGALVSIIGETGQVASDPFTGQPYAPQLTGADGRYDIPQLGTGRYALRVVPPTTYSFPSEVEPSVFAARRQVSEPSYGRDGYRAQSGSGLFNGDLMGGQGIIDVPVDPDLTRGQLAVTKTAEPPVVGFGDLVSYTLTVRNGSDAVLLDARISDRPAPGLRLMRDTVRVDGAIVTPQTGVRPRDFIVPVGRLDIGQTATITYRAQVGPDARPGDLNNIALANGRTGGGLIARSAEAVATVTVSDDGLLSDRAYIVGRSWVDLDGDDRFGEGDIAMPGVRLWMDDGTWVLTDEDGRYSVYGLEARRRILRVDPESLPAGLSAHLGGPRSLLDGAARFVDLTAGEMYRADIPLLCAAPCDVEALPALAERRSDAQSGEDALEAALAFQGQIGDRSNRDLARQREQAGPDGDISSGTLSSRGGRGLPRDTRPMRSTETGSLKATEAPVAVSDPEVLAETLGPVDLKTGAWLYPAPDAQGRVILRTGSVVMAVRAGLSPKLVIDGETIGEDRLGALVENRERKAVVAAWYGLDLEPGLHDLSVVAEDDFGNERTLLSQTVHRPGRAERLDVVMPTDAMTADGQSVTNVTLRALDADGLAATGTEFMTVSLRLPSGEGAEDLFQDADLQPTVPGHQIRLKDGEAVLRLRAPASAVDLRLALRGDRLSHDAVLPFRSSDRELFGVGLVSLGLSATDVSGIEPADADLFDETFDVDGRASLFLKGRIKGDMLLTLSFDSERGRDDDLFRDIDPEQYYPIYGDSSLKGFEAQARSPLYVRIERGDASLMWGDFRTDSRAQDRLLRRRSALTGANARIDDGDTVVEAFAAETRNQRRTVRLPGDGTALGQILPGAPIIPNSEVLTVEIRAANNPGLVVEERTLSRFADYLLDDVTGRLVLQAPLASFDPNGNPVFLVADYETRQEASSGVIAGLRVETALGSTRLFAAANLDDGATVQDATPDMRRVAVSAGAEVRLGANGSAYVEVANMETTDDQSQAQTQAGSGHAVRLGVEGVWLGTRVEAEYAEASQGFSNPDAPILAGRREVRAELSRSFGSNTEGALSSTLSEEMETGQSRETHQALLTRRFGRFAVTAGPRYTRDTSRDGQTDAPELDYLSALLRLEAGLSVADRAVTARVEAEQDLEEGRTRLQVGADVAVRDDTKLYVTHRLLDELPQQTFAADLGGAVFGARQHRTLVGLETNSLFGTDVYGEWRRGGLIDADLAEAAFGLRASWEVADGIQIAPQFEWVEALAGSGPETAPGAGSSQSLSVALADRRSENALRTIRAEGRNTDNATFYGLRAAWAQRLSNRVTAAIKSDLSYDNQKAGEDSLRSRVTLGLARRSEESGETDLFAVYQWLNEDTPGVMRDVHILSAHATRDFGDDWRLSGRLGASWQSDTRDGLQASANAQLASARLIHTINERWDIEARGAVRSTGWGDAHDAALGLGLGWKIRDNARVAVGYNVVGFRDRDLDPRGYDAQGLFWSLDVAIDESWFGWLRP